MRLLLIVVLSAFFSLLPLLGTTVAQENTTTTTTTTENITVTIPPAPSISPREGGEATVSGKLDLGVAHIYYTCFYVGSPRTCPNATYTLIEPVNNTPIWSQSYMVDPQNDCKNSVCRYKLDVDLQANYTRLILDYTLHYQNTTHSGRLVLTAIPPQPAELSFLLSLIPPAIIVGLATRYDIQAAAIGGIAATATYYLLSATGLLQFDPFPAYITIAVAIILIILAKKT